jgi:Family of unknown function (DUF5694)
MRTITVSLGLLTVLGGAWSQSNTRLVTRPEGDPTTPGRAQVMILGVAHLVARRDVHNSTFEDSPLSPKRQTQIADIIDHLARFHPTKVLIEAPVGDTGYINRYRRFRAGTFTLPADESYQIGFRLAARAGDTAIYPIDTFGPTLIDDSSAAGKQITAFLTAHFSSITTSTFAAYLAHSDTLERTGTYLDLLRYLNTDAAIHANASLYSVLDGMGREADSAGSAYVSQWYTRNCYIFSNVLSVISPSDRVVVVIGQGHEYLLRELARLNPNLVDVDPLSYLK